MFPVKNSRNLKSDDGSIVLEAAGFAVIAFGLVLSLSIQVFEVERRLISLQALARNVMRYSLINSAYDFESNVSIFQKLDPLVIGEALDVSVSCSLNQCSQSGELVWLEISHKDASARVFGVIP